MQTPESPTWWMTLTQPCQGLSCGWLKTKRQTQVYIRQNRFDLQVNVTPLSAHSSAKASRASHLATCRSAPSIEHTSILHDSKYSLEMAGNLAMHSANGPDFLFISPQYASVAIKTFILLLHVNVFGSSTVLHLFIWKKNGIDYNSIIYNGFTIFFYQVHVSFKIIFVWLCVRLILFFGIIRVTGYFVTVANQRVLQFLPADVTSGTGPHVIMFSVTISTQTGELTSVLTGHGHRHGVNTVKVHRHPTGSRHLNKPTTSEYLQFPAKLTDR